MKRKLLISKVVFLFFFSVTASSQQWEAFTSDCCLGGFVNSFSVDSANLRLYASGEFGYFINGNPNVNQYIGYYASLTNDWHYLGSAPEYWDDRSYCVLFHNDTVYNGGAFHSITNHSNHIAMFNGTNWQKMNDGFAQPTNWLLPAIYSLVYYDNQLYAGGNLTALLPSFDSVFCIARWDGTNWNGLPSIGFGSGIYLVPDSESYIVRTMIEFNGELFVGGIFNQAGGITVNGVAKWNGVAWDSAGAYQELVGPMCFAKFNNELYMGGGAGIAKYEDSLWTSVEAPIWGSFGIGSGVIYSMCVYNNSLVVGGIFDTIGGVAAKNIARWDGQNWSAFTTGVTIPGFNGQVKALATLDGCLYVGGMFTEAGGLSVQSIARWCEPLSTQEANSSQNISIYPNPAKDFISITGLQNKKATLKIFDVIGNEIITEEINALQIKINVSTLQKGIYLYSVTDNNGNFKAGKFLKQQNE